MKPAAVLVPLDGSETARAALPYAEAIAEAVGGTLHLLAVVCPWADALPSTDAETVACLKHRRHRCLRQYLKGIAAHRHRDVPVTTMVLPGEPADVILNTADELDAAIIVLTAHGYGRADSRLIGSVAQGVVRRSARPTLLLRPSVSNEPERNAR